MHMTQTRGPGLELDYPDFSVNRTIVASGQLFDNCSNATIA
jgi:hypothetical protein